MGNIFFDNILKSIKINGDEIIKQQKEEERKCGQTFVSKSKFNRYCPKCKENKP